MLRKWMLGHGYITKPEVTRPYLTYFASFSTIFYSEILSQNQNDQKSRAEKKSKFSKKKIQRSKKVHIRDSNSSNKLNEHYGLIRPIIRT